MDTLSRIGSKAKDRQREKYVGGAAGALGEQLLHDKREGNK